MNHFYRLLFLGSLLLAPFSTRAQQTIAPSRIELHSFLSSSLGISKSFNIYLPANYDQTNERYPVIYLFRGHEREWANPGEDNSRQGRTVKDDADQVIASGQMGNVILVMPGMSSTDNAVPTCAVNMLAPALGGTVDGLGTGKFEDYLVRELIPYIDHTYRTIPSRSLRAVDGFSLGGYTSMMLASRHPELFASAGSFDGTLMWLDFQNPARLDTLNDLWVTNSMFDRMFNRPRDIAYMTTYNEANLVKSASASRARALDQMQFLLRATPDGNHDRTQHFCTILEEKGITNGFPVIDLTPTAQHNWYYADMYAMQSFPKHWTKFQEPISSLSTPLAGPAPKASVSGTVPLSWRRGGAESAVTLLEASSDRGAHWQTLLFSAAKDSTFQWDTRQFPDGTRYTLRLYIIAGDSTLGFAESAGAFTVNNPGAAAPDVDVTSPAAGDTVAGNAVIRWDAADADGDALIIAIDFSADGGTTWKPIASSLANSGVYTWTTTSEVNSALCFIRLRASDGTQTTEAVSKRFMINNARYPVRDPRLIHRTGTGDGSIAAVRVSSEPLLTIAYRITFDGDSAGSGTTYSVARQNTLLIDHAKLQSGLEGPLCDGMRFIITDYTVPQPGVDSIRWVRGASTLEASVSLPIVNLGAEILRGVPYPADYLLTTSDHVVDTSGTFLDAAALPMKFSLWNKTENRKAEVIFNDYDGNAALSRNDELYIVEKDPSGRKELTWQIVFPANEVYTPPAAGDELLIKILKPFTARDTFDFIPIVDAVATQPRVPQSLRLEQNYPNPFNPATMIRFQLARKGAVRLTIFDLLGREVARLLDNEVMAPGEHRVEWNAAACPSGVYFYRLESAGISQTKKLVLVR